MDETVLIRQPEIVDPPIRNRICFTDRELSWLQFNLRVLNEAGDSSVPLLERLKFLSIYQSNLDEFFMVRVGSLIHRSLLIPDYTDEKTGWSTTTQMKWIIREVQRQMVTEESVYEQLKTDLTSAGIEPVDFHRISKVDESMARKFFAEKRHLLSPRIVDAEHPMPFLENRESYAAVLLKKRDRYLLGLVALSRLPAHFVFETEGPQKVVLTDALVSHFASLLFKRYDVKDCCIIRVTRNADVFIEEHNRAADGDFRLSMEKLLRKRKRMQIVRLQIQGRPDRHLRDLLKKYLKVQEKQIFQTIVPFCLDFGGSIAGAGAMRYPERRGKRSVLLRKGDYFRYLDSHDILLSFPYQSMLPFIEMLYEAADDPDVVSIRITLYRLAASSKLAAALAYAADQGKDVLCLLELRARFDEKNNIDYSEMLEEAGCSVIYGLPEHKVHSKLCLITRKNGDTVSYITQIGTGNYNEVTSEQYCDLSLITSDKEIGRDTAEVFDSLALGEVPAPTATLITSPQDFRPRLLEALDRELKKAADGHVVIKVNSLNDMTVMNKLIECSRSGVKVELFVRGICCLLPGIPGLTDNIRVRSVVGRYLEHSRIYAFGTGADLRLWIGSGDLLNRNTQRRVEAFAEVKDPAIREQVLEVLEAFRQDGVKGWDMQSDGSYRKIPIPTGTDSQERLCRYFSTQQIDAPAVRRSLFSRIADILRRRKG